MKTSITLVIIAIALAACASPTPTPMPPAATINAIQIIDPWVRAVKLMPSGTSSSAPSMGSMDMSGGGTTSAAYMLIRNTGAADRLMQATSDAAKTVELDNITQTNGVVKMVMVNQIDVPAKGQTALTASGFHIMLVGLTRDLKIGDMIKLTLMFEQAGQIQFDVPVRE